MPTIAGHLLAELSVGVDGDMTRRYVCSQGHDVPVCFGHALIPARESHLNAVQVGADTLPR